MSGSVKPDRFDEQRARKRKIRYKQKLINVLCINKKIKEEHFKVTDFVKFQLLFKKNLLNYLMLFQEIVFWMKIK